MNLTLAATLPDNGAYVAASFLVFLALALIYFAIMAAKLSRLEGELVELNELADRFVAEGKPGAAAEVIAEEAPAVGSDEGPQLDGSLMPARDDAASGGPVGSRSV